MGGGCLPEATHSLGAFANAFPSIEALIEGLISLVESQAVVIALRRLHLVSSRRYCSFTVDARFYLYR